MKVFRTLLLLFIVVPLAEVYLLVRIGSVWGAWPTIGLVVLTAVIGAALVRDQGFRTLSRVQEALAREEIPAIELLEGAVILVAGALLLTPGFITDALGFAALYRPLRLAAIRRLFLDRPRFGGPGSGTHRGSSTHRGGRVIEGEYGRERD